MTCECEKFDIEVYTIANKYRDSAIKNVYAYAYSDSTSLREHFVEQHFLCEEGDCKNNIFSAVFRTDIDLKGIQMPSQFAHLYFSTT